MKYIPLGLLIALTMIGCATRSPIDGEYTLDRKFQAMRVAEIMKKDAPEIDVNSTAKKIAFNLKKKNEVITIAYPDFTKTWMKEGETTPTTNTHQLTQTGEEQYLLVIKKENERIEIPFKYDSTEKSLTSEIYRYTRR